MRLNCCVSFSWGITVFSSRHESRELSICRKDKRSDGQENTLKHESRCKPELSCSSLNIDLSVATVSIWKMSVWFKHGETTLILLNDAKSRMQIRYTKI